MTDDFPILMGRRRFPTYARIVEQYPDYRFDGLDHSKYPIITSRWDTICERFYEEYANREIGLETLDLWWLKLKNTFNANATKYERFYALYDKYKNDMSDKALGGFIEDYSSHDQNSGIDKNDIEGGTRYIDTPDSKRNKDKDYADRITDNNNSSTMTYGKQNDASGTRSREETGSMIMENINKIGESYIDIDTKMIGEFNRLFLQILE